ncbi:unnamed protein product, partial [Vitis vinifera]|uniref:Uncharacterized protein n=1 Tax=Vitis vinifera TaxID=29760 RepID=D7TYD3_VITVI
MALRRSTRSRRLTWPTSSGRRESSGGARTEPLNPLFTFLNAGYSQNFGSATSLKLYLHKTIQQFFLQSYVSVDLQVQDILVQWEGRKQRIVVQLQRLSLATKMPPRMGRKRSFQSRPCLLAWTRNLINPRRDLHPQAPLLASPKQKQLQNFHPTLLTSISLPLMMRMMFIPLKKTHDLSGNKGLNKRHLTYP